MHACPLRALRCPSCVWMSVRRRGSSPTHPLVASSKYASHRARFGGATCGPEIPSRHPTVARKHKADYQETLDPRYFPRGGPCFALANPCASGFGPAGASAPGTQGPHCRSRDKCAQYTREGVEPHESAMQYPAARCVRRPLRGSRARTAASPQRIHGGATGPGWTRCTAAARQSPSGDWRRLLAIPCLRDLRTARRRAPMN